MSKFHEQKAAAKKDVKYVYTNAQIEEIRKKAWEEGFAEGIHLSIGGYSLVLHNSFSFGIRGRGKDRDGRCAIAADRFTYMMRSVGKPGGMTVEQLKKAAWEYGGIKGVM